MLAYPAFVRLWLSGTVSWLGSFTFGLALQLLLIENRTHPFLVVRATELRRWVDSGDYTRVLGGDYPRRADDDTAKVSEAAAAAARSYGETFKQSQDALGKMVHDVAGVLGSMKLWLDEQLRRD